MINNFLYSSVLKTQLFKLSGFVLKKNISGKNIPLLLFKKSSHSFIFINPTFSLFQLILVFQFYLNLLLYKKKVIIGSIINSFFFKFSNYLFNNNFFLIEKSMGGLLTNKLGYSWTLLLKKIVLDSYPSIMIIFDKDFSKALKEFFKLGIPTIGFVSIEDYNFKNYVTYPLYFQYNNHILYFFIRVFIRLLFVYRLKI